MNVAVGKPFLPAASATALNSSTDRRTWTLISRGVTVLGRPRLRAMPSFDIDLVSQGRVSLARRNYPSRIFMGVVKYLIGIVGYLTNGLASLQCRLSLVACRDFREQHVDKAKEEGTVKKEPKSRRNGTGKHLRYPIRKRPLVVLLREDESQYGVRQHRGQFPGGHGWTLFQSDCRVALKTMRAESVNCVVTSPPYYWQRDYGVDGQIGHEASIQGYVDAIVECFQLIQGVLRDDGVVFLNLGDTYYSAKGKPHGRDKKNSGRTLARQTLRAVDGPGLGLPRKSLIGIPWRVALALQAGGWTLRSDIVWRRPGALPEPTAHDRPWMTHEHVFLFSKRPRYWFNRASLAGEEDIWKISPRPDNPGSHFAPFPAALVERCVLAGCPDGGTVLDPFAGSGTTLAVAGKLGRSAIGVELNSDYCSFVVKRLSGVVEQRNLGLAALDNDQRLKTASR